MSGQIWPFLISRNRCLDYCAVLVPDVLSKSGAFAPVFGAVELSGAHVESGAIQSASVSTSVIGPLTVFYRCQFATSNEGKLRDNSGRPIVTATGVVAEGNVTMASLPDDVMERADLVGQEAYSGFWNTSQLRKPSTSVTICKVDVPQPGPLPPQSRYSLRKQLGLGILGILFVAGILSYVISSIVVSSELRELKRTMRDEIGSIRAGVEQNRLGVSTLRTQMESGKWNQLKER